jgi:hypothetical protein
MISERVVSPVLNKGWKQAAEHTVGIEKGGSQSAWVAMRSFSSVAEIRARHVPRRHRLFAVGADSDLVEVAAAVYGIPALAARIPEGIHESRVGLKLVDSGHGIECRSVPESGQALIDRPEKQIGRLQMKQLLPIAVTALSTREELRLI